MPSAEFDSFAESYEQDLGKSLAITGESREYYAQRRIDWTAHCLARLNYAAKRVLDYGCGDGANVPMLTTRFQAEQTLGVDVSNESIALARRTHTRSGLAFATLDEWIPDGSTDLAFTNGVFHHIPPANRSACLVSIRKALRPGALFAFWENNPWNPGTRYVMSNCAFDENAITISRRQARKMLSEAGFKIVRQDSLFYFPRQLGFLRPVEKWLSVLPLGGQYLLLCRNSS